ncbi:MAG: DUF1292 domain-containing protein [Candidatus Pelethousia sp.]|nr:DUF1292 domain-containing protein [Candidatus Pelethousia sp.]
MDNERMDEVVLLDEAGEPVRFEHILTFLYEKERYIALSPLEEGTDAEADEAEVVLLKVVEKDGEETYATLDSEVLLNEVFDHFLDLMEELAEGTE